MSQGQFHIRSYTVSRTFSDDSEITVQLPRTFPRKGVIKQILIEGTDVTSLSIRLRRDFEVAQTFYLHESFAVPGVDSSVDGPFDFSGNNSVLVLKPNAAGTVSIRFDIEVR